MTFFLPEDLSTLEVQSMIERTLPPTSADFIDRRSNDGNAPGGERRQFNPSYEALSEDARELGEAIDQYKLVNRRRFINYEELLAVMKSLGYSK